MDIDNFEWVVLGRGRAPGQWDRARHVSILSETFEDEAQAVLGGWYLPQVRQRPRFENGPRGPSRGQSELGQITT